MKSFYRVHLRSLKGNFQERCQVVKYLIAHFALWHPLCQYLICAALTLLIRNTVHGSMAKASLESWQWILAIWYKQDDKKYLTS